MPTRLSLKKSRAVPCQGKGTSESPYVLLDLASDGDPEDGIVGGEREAPRSGSSAYLGGGVQEKTEDDESTPSSASAAQATRSSMRAATSVKPDATADGERKGGRGTNGNISEESSPGRRGSLGQQPVRDDSAEGCGQTRSLNNGASSDLRHCGKNVASDRGGGGVSPTVLLSQAEPVASPVENSRREVKHLHEPDREGENRKRENSAAAGSDAKLAASKGTASPSRSTKARAVASTPTCTEAVQNDPPDMPLAPKKFVSSHEQGKLFAVSPKALERHTRICSLVADGKTRGACVHSGDHKRVNSSNTVPFQFLKGRRTHGTKGDEAPSVEKVPISLHPESSLDGIVVLETDSDRSDTVLDIGASCPTKVSNAVVAGQGEGSCAPGQITAGKSLDNETGSDNLSVSEALLVKHDMSKALHSPTGQTSRRVYKRCGECTACLVTDCGECRICRDHTQYHGTHRLRKRCARKERCLNSACHEMLRGAEMKGALNELENGHREHSPSATAARERGCAQSKTGSLHHKVISLVDSEDDEKDNAGAVVTTAETESNANEMTSKPARSSPKPGSPSTAASTPFAEQCSKETVKNGGNTAVALMVSPEKEIAAPTSHGRVDALCIAHTGGMKGNSGLRDEKSFEQKCRGHWDSNAVERAIVSCPGGELECRIDRNHQKKVRCNERSSTSTGEPTSEQGVVKNVNVMVVNCMAPGTGGCSSPRSNLSPGGCVGRPRGEVEELTTMHRKCTATRNSSQPQDGNSMTARRSASIGEPKKTAQKEGGLFKKPDIVDIINCDKDRDISALPTDKNTIEDKHDAETVPSSSSNSAANESSNSGGPSGESDSDDLSIGPGLSVIFAGSLPTEKEDSSLDVVSGRMDSSTAGSTASSSEARAAFAPSSAPEVDAVSSSPRMESFSQVPDEYKWIKAQENIVYTGDAMTNQEISWTHSAVVLSDPVKQNGRWMVDVKWEIRGTKGKVDCRLCRQNHLYCRITNMAHNGQAIVRSVRNSRKTQRFGVFEQQKVRRTKDASVKGLPAEGQISASQTINTKGNVKAKHESEAHITKKEVNVKRPRNDGAWRSGGQLKSKSWSMKEMPDCSCKLKCGGDECIQKPPAGKRKRKKVDVGAYVGSPVSSSAIVRQESKGRTSELCGKSNGASSSSNTNPSWRGVPSAHTGEKRSKARILPDSSNYVGKAIESIGCEITKAVSRIKPLECSQKTSASNENRMDASFFVDEILRKTALKHVKRLGKEISKLQKENALLKSANEDFTGENTKIVPKEEETDPDNVIVGIVGITKSTPDEAHTYERYNAGCLKKKRDLVDAIAIEKGSKQSDPEGFGLVARRDIKKGDKLLDYSAVYCEGDPPPHFDPSRDYIKTSNGYFRIRESTTQWMNEARNRQLPNVRWGTYHDMDGPKTIYVLTWTATADIAEGKELLVCYEP